MISLNLPSIKISKHEWFTIIIAVILSRIVIYSLGLWGVSEFASGHMLKSLYFKLFADLIAYGFY